MVGIPTTKTILGNGNWKLVIELAVAIFILGGIWIQMRNLPQAVAEARDERIELSGEIRQVSSDMRVLVEKMDGFVAATAIRFEATGDAVRENERDIRRLERRDN